MNAGISDTINKQMLLKKIITSAVCRACLKVMVCEAGVKKKTTAWLLSVADVLGVFL